MRHATNLARARANAALAAPTIPLLDASDLPGDDDVFALPGGFPSDDTWDDDDRFATLSVARACDE